MSSATQARVPTLPDADDLACEVDEPVLLDQTGDGRRQGGRDSAQDLVQPGVRAAPRTPGLPPALDGHDQGRHGHDLRLAVDDLGELAEGLHVVAALGPCPDAATHLDPAGVHVLRPVSVIASRSSLAYHDVEAVIVEKWRIALR